jgi:hypothetical protein
MENVSDSITNVANLRAARDQMESASKGNFWDSLLSGSSSLFS